MKILHLGNPYFLQNFRELGHDVKWAACDKAADVVMNPSLESAKNFLGRVSPRWTPDLVVLGDDSVHPKVLGLEALEVPLVWYAIDSHIHANWHRYYAAVFDVIFVAQQDWAPVYRVDPDRQLISWKPLFCQWREDRCLDLDRDIPLSFVGTLNPIWNPERVELIRRIQERYPIIATSGPYLETFNRSMMVLNQSVANDVNFRTFQAMASGALLMTERVGNGFGELFQDGTHCAVYERGNIDQLLTLVEHYRAHAGEREAVAFQGHQAVLNAHTSMHRAQSILDVAATEQMDARVAKRISRQLQIQWSLASAYEISARKYYQAAKQEEESLRRWRLREMADGYHFLAATIRGQLTQFAEAEAAVPG
ncbi:MAG: glycosyltransferase family 1 protein [Nitrospiraceae bacterium]|nr:MAG: glycosyltransferase family 1 protein [Nitrospiraceae bacterium]